MFVWRLKQWARRCGSRLRMRGAQRELSSFCTWQDALTACAGKGYCDDRIAHVVSEKTAVYRERILDAPFAAQLGELVLWSSLGPCCAACDGRGIVTVVDVGGACGVHCFLARRLYAGRRFDWRVVETPTMVERARRFEDDGLRFFPSLQDAVAEGCSPDVVYSSGTLQCVPDPYGLVDALVALGAPFLALSRVAVTCGPTETITLHRHRLGDNGPGPMPAGIEDGPCVYPYTYALRSKIEERLTRRYTLDFTVRDASGISMSRDAQTIGISYFCRLRLQEATNPFRGTGD